MSAARGLVMTVLCTESDALRFCRRMSADVNQGPLHLARAMITGHQVYPFHDSVLGSPDVLVRCEFRPRNVSAMLSDHHVEDLLRRLEKYEVIDAHTLDSLGSILDRVPMPISVGT